jgi:hypothetical protein
MHTYMMHSYKLVRWIIDALYLNQKLFQQCVLANLSLISNYMMGGEKYW